MHFYDLQKSLFAFFKTKNTYLKHFLQGSYPRLSASALLISLALLGSVCPQLFLLWYLDPVAVIHTISSLEVEEVSCGAAVTCGVASTWLEAPALAAETSLFPEEEFSFAVAFEPEELLPFDWLVCACVPLSSLSPGL